MDTGASFSQRRTAFWSRGSRSLAATTSTHSSTDLPVRSRKDSETAATISWGPLPRLISRPSSLPGDAGAPEPFEVIGAGSAHATLPSMTIPPRIDGGTVADRSLGRAVEFFERQFRRQVDAADFVLNPFETRALEHLSGEVLDLGCGLGNLSLEAARRDHRVVAVDTSPTAVARIRGDARREGLPVEALERDLERWEIDRPFDTIVCIGLVMFFSRERALRILRDLQEHVRPGGRAVVNTLIEGTTYMEMFDPAGHCLLAPDELEEAFAGWTVLESRRDTFPAPGETLKVFSTVIAESPAGQA